MIFNSSLTVDSLEKEFGVWSKSRKTLRFGQYICNKYLNEGVSAPEIFYDENAGDAYWQIVDILNKQED